MSYTDLGSGQGWIYAFMLPAGYIGASAPNTPDGVRQMKLLGLKARALGLGQRGVFTITVGSITGNGDVTQILVDTVDQINGSIAYAVGQEDDLAVAIAAAINTTTPVSGQNYAAVAVGNVIYGYAPASAPPTINDDIVAVSNTGDITITTTDVENASDQTQIYSTTHGFRFFINANPSASQSSYVGAEEITKYLIPQTLDGALPSRIVTLSEGVATAERIGAISFLRLGPQSGNSDDCIGINPHGYADNDLIYVSGFDENNSVTFAEDINGNFQLKNDESYLSAGVGTWILFQHIGGTFYEIMRASSVQGLIDITYGQGLAAIAAGTLVPGGFYRITDRGDRGLILQATATNQFSLEGKFLAAVPDYQNTTGNFIGDWWSGLSPSVGSITTYADGTQYVNTTGVNTVFNPSSDTTNWTVLDRSTSTDYVEETHFVKFNYSNDRLVYRSDNRGNTVQMDSNRYSTFSFIPGIDKFDFFWWGNDEVISTNVENAVIKRGVFHTLSQFWGNSFKNIFMTSISGSGIGKFNNNSLEGTTDDIIFYSHNATGNSSLSLSIIKILEGSLTLNMTEPAKVSQCLFNVIAGFAQLTMTQSIDRSTINIQQQSQGSSANFIATVSFKLARKYLSESGRSSFPINVDLIADNLDLNDKDIYGDLTVNMVKDEDLETISNISPALSEIIIRPSDGGALFIRGTDYASLSDDIILIPDNLSDGSPGAGGLVILDGARGDYAILKVIRGDIFTYFVVEVVAQF